MASLVQHLTPVVFEPVSSAAQEARVAANRGQPLDAAQAEEVISQFEKMFLRMMLKSMRSATATLNPDGLGGQGPFGGGAQGAYLEMFDGEIAARLAQGRGLGLGDLLRAQLGLASAAQGTEAPAGGALPSRRDFGTPSMPPPAQGAWRAVPAAAAPPAAHGPGATPPRQGLAAPAAPPAGPPASALQLFEDAREFVASLLPLARRTAARLGVSARGLLAQMALETGWGRHVPPAADGRSSSHNLFGIKAGEDWAGARTTLSTLEVEDGVFQRRHASFRVYPSLASALEDYVSLLRDNPRYAGALDVGEDIAAFARGLQAGGYATDPDYAHKIQSIASGKLNALLLQLGESR